MNRHALSALLGPMRELPDTRLEHCSVRLVFRIKTCHLYVALRSVSAFLSGREATALLPCNEVPPK